MQIPVKMLYAQEFRLLCSIRTDTDEDTGKILVKFEQPAGHDAELMMKSLVLGLQGIQNNYGVDYVTLNFKEV